MTDKVLFVDDDAEILASFKRQYRKQFEVDTALNGMGGLEAIRERGPFAVVVSDKNMPSMDGIQFLAQVKKLSHETVRIMLTGFADLQATMDAVNEGYVFRFLTKPCMPDVLLSAVSAGIRQHHLIMAERELLEQTLNGSIAMLSEVLSLVNPVAFSRAARLRAIAQHVIEKLNLADGWQYEVAALLSQIGFVTIPPELLNKSQTQSQLTDAEQKMLAAHPAVARKLIENIPRLDSVAMIVANQNRGFSDSWGAMTTAQILGAQILRLALDYDRLISEKTPPDEAIAMLARQSSRYNPDLLRAMKDYSPADIDWQRKRVEIEELQIGMIAGEDVETTGGALLLRADQEVTFAVLERLKNFHLRGNLNGPLVMLIPRD